MKQANIAAPGRGPAAAMLLLSVTMRLFWGVAADHPSIANAAWICPLAGLVIYLPFYLAVNRAEKLGGDSAWGNLANIAPKPVMHAAELIFSLLLLFDCASSMRLMANTANLLALGDVSIILLLIPLAALLAADVLIGAEAVGSSARLWLRVVPLLFVVMFIVQAQVYNPSWLTPLLGSGVQSILGGGFYSAGCLALLTLPWMIALPDRNKKPAILYIGLAALAAAILLAAQAMLCPPFDGMELSRTGRVKLILSNGRAALSLQMLLVVLWYGGLMHLIGTEAVTAACYLRRIIPRAPQWSFAAGEALLTIIAASSGLTTECTARLFYPWMFACLGALLIVAMLSGLLGKGGRKCEN